MRSLFHICSKQGPYLKKSITALPARGLRLTLESMQPPWLRSSLYGVAPRNFLMFVEMAFFVFLVFGVSSRLPLTRFPNIEPGNAPASTIKVTSFSGFLNLCRCYGFAGPTLLQPYRR
jgi:hypothetical protein